MKIVIDIPEDLYKGIERRDGALETEYVCDELMKAVDNGTPLPKGHGRLIDADELKTLCYEVLLDSDNPNRADGLSSANGIVEEDIDLAPTIIEADNGEEWNEGRVDG